MTPHTDAIAEWRGRIKPGHVNILRFKRIAALADWTFESFQPKKGKIWHDLNSCLFRGHRILVAYPTETNDAWVKQVYVGDTKLLVDEQRMPFALFRSTSFHTTIDMPTKSIGAPLLFHVVTSVEQRAKIHVLGYMKV